MSGSAMLLVDAEAAPGRHAQIATLCARLGLDVEYLLKPGTALPEGLDHPPTRFGILPPQAADDASVASSFLAAFAKGRECRLIYGPEAGTLPLPREAGRVLRVVEATAVEAGGVSPETLVLEQTPRGADVPGAAARVAFLPPPVQRAPHTRLGRAAYVGWVGRWKEDLRVAWGELADALFHRKAAPRGGILLAGEGVGSMRLRSELAPVLRVSEAARLDGARRAMGLAVLPVRDPEPYAADISRLLGAGVPVMTLADCAASFQDSWGLPVAGDMDELAARVAEASLPSSALQDAAEATLRSFEVRLRDAEDALVAQLRRQLARRAASQR